MNVCVCVHACVNMCVCVCVSVRVYMCVHVASFPGLHPSFCHLQYENRGEGLEGFARDACHDRHKTSSVQDHYVLVQ